MEQERETPSESVENIDLWCAYPDDLLEPDAREAAISLLDAEERTRADRFRFDDRRREHIATHALKRIALSAAASLPPQDWRFLENKHGKPSIDHRSDPDTGLRFNLSNSRELVICLVARSPRAGTETGAEIHPDVGPEVGVDVEAHTRAAQIVELAPRFFSAAEYGQLAQLPAADQPDRALSLWTLKESYIKARGKGLALPLDKFSFVFGGPQGIHLEIDPSLGDDASRWQFCLLNHAQHRIAAMIESRIAPQLNVWEARPPHATPIKLNHLDVTWFPRPEGFSNS